MRYTSRGCDYRDALAAGVLAGSYHVRKVLLVVDAHTEELDVQKLVN